MKLELREPQLSVRKGGPHIVYMSDDQNPRRGVLYKRMNGVCCCKFVVRFAWEAQESARAGARYINIVVLFCISEHLLL